MGTSPWPLCHHSLAASKLSPSCFRILLSPCGRTPWHRSKVQPGSDQSLTPAQGFSAPPPLPPSLPPPNPSLPWKDKASQFPHPLPLLPISFYSRLRRPFVKGRGRALHKYLIFPTCPLHRLSVPGLKPLCLL